MSQPNVKLPEIPEAEQTPLVQALLETILKQQERIEELEAEVKRLKELKGKPKVKPSRMDAETDKQGEDGTGKKGKPGPKRVLASFPGGVARFGEAERGASVAPGKRSSNR